ncbi:MAG: hypothetical protein U0324_42490 [Polyangiales bacterium]
MKTHLVVLAALAAACAETSSSTGGDAAADAVDAAPDVVDATSDLGRDVAPEAAADVPGGSCRWRVGAAVDLPGQGAGVRCALADLAAGAPGAWVARACDRLAGDADARQPLVIDRVDATGATASTTRAAEGATARAWLAVDDALDRRAVLRRGPMGGGESIVTLGRDGAPTGAQPVASAPTHFSLGDHQDLAVDRAGFTTVAQQIRALWGVSLLHLDAAGRAVEAVDLMPTGAFIPRIKRVATADRGFFLAWAEGADAGPGSLRVRRYRENGTAVSFTAVLDARLTSAAATAPLRVAIAPTAGGALAVWEAEADTLPPLRTLAARPLADDATPRADASLLTSLGFYGGGLDAAAAGGDVLVTAVTGSGVLRLVVAALGPDGSPRGEPLQVAMVAPPSPDGVFARVVPTASGALVAFQRDAATVAVAPLTCER